MEDAYLCRLHMFEIQRVIVVCVSKTVFVVVIISLLERLLGIRFALLCVCERVRVLECVCPACL